MVNEANKINNVNKDNKLYKVEYGHMHMHMHTDPEQNIGFSECLDQNMYPALQLSQWRHTKIS